MVGFGTPRDVRHPRVVHHRRVTVRDVDLGPTAEAFGNPARDAPDARGHLPAYRRVEGADRPQERDLLRDDVEGGAPVDGADRDHCRLQGRHLPGDQSLEARDHVGRRDHRVRAPVRHRAVAPAAAHHDRQVVHRRHERACPDPDRPHRLLVPEVNADRDVHPLQHARFDDRLRPPLTLLRRLEQEAHGSRELPPGENAGGGRAHGHVAVVAAGVHHPGGAGGVRHLVLLLDGQAVEVDAEEDGPSRVPAGRDHHPGAPDPDAHAQPASLEVLEDPGRGARLLEGQLGVGVQVAAERDHLCAQIGHLRRDRGHAEL
jgi:hypothetical protein